MTRTRRLPLVWSVVLILAGVWVGLEYVLPVAAMWLTGGSRPLPIPAVVQAIYLLLAVVGCAVYVTCSDEAMAEFVRPVAAFLRGPAPGRPAAWRGARLAVLALLPLLVGGLVYARAVPRVASPTSLRIQHPTIPGAYERLRNPFREPTDEVVRTWMAGTGVSGDLEAGRRAYTEAALAEGRVVFQMNCRPCHGDAADGQGPMAWGFRLKPANFTDPGTIATVVEAYAFWRVTEGGPGLPPEGSPWDSAMPIWKQDLTDEQKWKAIMAAYDLAGVEPRKPERLHAALLPRAAEAQPGPPPATPDNLARGRAIYVKRCLVCHGDKGDGKGPVAPFLEPRPRDFVTASFKLRSTPSGEAPTDADLFRVVTRGVPGTAMAGWPTLSEQERWLVIGYVKSLSDAFKDKPTLVAPARDVAASPERIEQGRQLYERAKCWECHGQEGRGDGPAAPTLKDDAGERVQAANLTKGWRIKGGREARDIFLRFSTGMDGTPMPSFADSLSEDERWALAHYVRSLQTAEEPGDPVVLTARRVAGELPTTPDDPRWRQAPPLAVPLAGQVLARPRWQHPSVDAVSVRAYYNDRAIAFLLEWDDRVQDVRHAPGADPELAPWTYPRRDLTPGPRAEALRDAVRLQFPRDVPPGPERPHFLLGGAGRPVALWHWQADREAAGQPSVVKELATGFQTPVRPQAAEAQDVTGRGSWKDGRWRVVMSRSLRSRAPSGDVTFEPGRLIPFAVQAWDGSNGEKGLMMALSSWAYVVLEASVPATAYAAALFGVVLAGALEGWLVRRARRRPG
jgi:DMSO reductase family type II enzyme heme b subunit